MKDLFVKKAELLDECFFLSARGNWFLENEEVAEILKILTSDDLKQIKRSLRGYYEELIEIREYEKE